MLAFPSTPHYDKDPMEHFTGGVYVRLFCGRNSGIRAGCDTNDMAKGKKYEDIAGFCKSAATTEIVEHGHVLTPGRYVGAAAVEEDDEPFEGKMQRLVGELDEQCAESRRLEKTIRKNLAGIVFAPEEPA